MYYLHILCHVYTYEVVEKITKCNKNNVINNKKKTFFTRNRSSASQRKNSLQKLLFIEITI